MIKTIQDECPGASSARKAYLAARIERVFGEQEARLVEVAIRLRVVPVGGEDRFEAAIRCDTVDGTTFCTTFVRPTLPLALATVFEGAAYRLSMGSPRKSRLPAMARRAARS